MTYDQFQKRLTLLKRDILKETFAANRNSIRVKKEKTALKNLEKVFMATIKISNEKGFRAMTMRDLSKEAGMSMGAIYSYFHSKENLLETLQLQRRTIAKRVMEERIGSEKNALAKLRAAIQIHLYLSEVMQPWYFFSYMEAKSLSGKEREKTMTSELESEKIFLDVLQQGQAEGLFTSHDPQLGASVIKAILQDWYLKRWKYRSRHITVDTYAQFVMDFIESYYCIPQPARKGVKGQG